MRLVSCLAIAAALAGSPDPALAQQTQIRPVCLHGPAETPAEAQRRDEALTAVRVITQALARPSFSRAPYPDWEELADSQAVLRLRGLRGRDGDVARSMNWGAAEPLPGWRIHYLAAVNGYAVSLTDTRDGCSFTYHANDTSLLVAGVAIQDRGRIVPLNEQMDHR
jgi:hypothetical protein